VSWQLLAGIPSRAQQQQQQQPRQPPPQPWTAKLAATPAELQAALAEGTLRDGPLPSGFRATAAARVLPSYAFVAPAGSSSEGSSGGSASRAASPRAARAGEPGAEPASPAAAAPAAAAAPPLPYHFPELPLGLVNVESYAGAYEAGLREDAAGAQHLGDGSVYNGGFRGGRRNGFGTLRGSGDRRVFSGKWVAGAAEGRGSLVGAEGLAHEGLWSGSALAERTGGSSSRVLPEASQSAAGLSLRY
jgi:hypothetical protein